MSLTHDKNKSKKEKYNIIMPESDYRTLCIMVDKPISEDGYKQNFLPRLNKIIKQNGDARLLVYFKDYQGWEEKAAEKDLEIILKKGHKVRKLAVVSPPPQEIRRLIIKEPLIDGKKGLQIFREKDLEDAIKWVKS